MFKWTPSWRAMLCFCMLITVSCMPLHASNQPVTLALQNTNLADAVRLLASFLQLNVIISPAVTGSVTLQLHDATPLATLDTLLISHSLGKIKMGNVWFVAPLAELIKRKQDELKWQTLAYETAPILTEVWQIHYAKAEDIAKLLQDTHSSFISKQGRVRVDARTNLLCIQDSATHLIKVRHLIRHLDVPVKQIAIHARLVSIDQDVERELGVDFTIRQSVEGKNLGTILHDAGQYSLAIAKLANGSLLDVKLSALEKEGRAKLISSPSLFTSNQQPASIEAGEEVPYQEVSESGGTAVAFKKAVLALRVTPQVLPGNRVLLQLQINQDRPSNKMVQGVPTISTRQIMTSVLVKTGQTIVLGGIFETDEDRGQERVPFISAVPVIGWLFQHNRLREKKRELLIFVTPKIITQET